jgi:hypothetical protein
LCATSPRVSASAQACTQGLGELWQVLGGDSQPATTARYAHLDADPMRRAVDIIGDTISAAMKRKPSAEMVLIKRTMG